MRTKGARLGCALLLIAMLSGRGHAKPMPADEDLALLKRTSKAFAAVSRRAMPAVVFIEVEKTIEGPRMGAPDSRFNDPFGFFGNEYMDHFFGDQAVPRRFLQHGQGSGFLISKDGYILTNSHVVGDADKITVTLHDGRKLTAKRVGADPKSEVAVIKVDGDEFPYLDLGDSTALEIGEWVIAVGNPFGLMETVTVGVVSAKGRSNIGIAEYEDFIQTDAAINPGNSGGPLLNIDGRAIGINTAIYSPNGAYMGIGFAVPINMARRIKDQLVATGSVTRGFLGIQLNRVDIDEDLAASFGLPEPRGVLVADVIEDSPAEKAGLRDGDIILEVDGDEAGTNSRFRNRVSMLAPGTKVTLTVFREGKELDVRVSIGTFPKDEAVRMATPDLLDAFGFSVRDLAPELARRFGYEFDEGVIVVSVESGSPAFDAGIQPGNLILEVNHQAVSGTDGFYRAIAGSAKTGRALLRVKGRDRSWFVLLKTE